MERKLQKRGVYIFMSNAIDVATVCLFLHTYAQLIYHAVLILRYTNSYTNALILLVRQRKTKPSIEIKEKVRIRAFTTFSSNAIIMHNYNSNETFDHTFSSK